MQKRFRAFAMTIPLLLFAAGEQQALPALDIEDARQPATNKTEAAPQPAPAKARRGGKKLNRRPRGLAKMNKGRSRQHSRRNSTATVAARRLYILRREYTRRTRRLLIVTSFRRTPAEQARALRNIIRRRGMGYMLSLYKNGPAIREIANAYRAHRRHPQEAQRQMTIVIENQIARNVYVSAHLRGQAVDIRSRGRNGARLPILRDVARGVGAQVSVEADHFHVRLV